MIHPTAIIAPDALIGSAVTIHPHAIVGRHATIGERCVLGHGTVVEDGAVIGDDVSIWDYSKVQRGAVLEEGVHIGYGSIVCRGVRIGRRSRIHNHVSLSVGTSVGAFIFIGPGAKFPNNRHPRAFGSWTPGSAVIEMGASIGANATVVCGEKEPTKVGAFVLLMAATRASRSLVPFGLYRGNERCGWVNAAGRTVSREPGTLPTRAILIEGCVDEAMEVRATEFYRLCLEELATEGRA